MVSVLNRLISWKRSRNAEIENLALDHAACGCMIIRNHDSRPLATSLSMEGPLWGFLL